MEKTCTQCKQIKSQDDFHYKNKALGLRQSYCKLCYKKYDNYRYNFKREIRLRQLKESYERNKHKWAEKTRKSRELYPEKWKARQTLRNAIASGKVIKYPCQTCGDIKSHGHHEDYSKPLEVLWLCAKHHMEKHRTVDSLGRKNYIRTK